MAITKAEKPAQPDTSIVLELAHYSRYHRDDTIYEKGQAYRFNAEHADMLMQEVDEHTGLPVWKRWKPAAKKMLVEREVQPNDMTSADLRGTAPADPAAKAIAIGDDDDIADHLASGGEEAHTI